MIGPVDELLKDLCLLLESRYLNIPLLLNDLLSVIILPWSLSFTCRLCLLSLAWLSLLLCVVLARIVCALYRLLLLLLLLLLQEQELLLLLLKVEQLLLLLLSQLHLLVVRRFC